MNLELSPIIVGTMRLGSWGANLNRSELERFIDECVDMGLVDFDHADIYGHYTEEAHFGEVLKRRSDLVSRLRITTKCGIKLPERFGNRANRVDAVTSARFTIESA